ncbi:hypothetical protein F4804DRAFT_302591 [Jackrogersella minutella]|nr:hypothetical protein F4804DRAFT_302591 [Jackrogersella minutella]
MDRNLFFEGKLEDAIFRAIQESKMVLAFVTDGNIESEVWENEIYTNDTLKSALEAYAVALRLPEGSVEAGFLEALFPIPQKPTVVIIHKGTLKEYIQAGTPTEDLVRRIEAILKTVDQSRQATAASASQAVNQPPPAPASTGDDATNDLYDDDDNVPVTSTSAPAEASQHEASAREPREEARAETERHFREKESEDTNQSNDSHHTAAERTYAEEIRQRKIHSAEERKRILKRIEDDKRERRERREREAAERKASLLLSKEANGEGPSGQIPAIPLARRPGGGSHGDHCNLQARLFDGSTIRSRFKSDATLNGEVRKWIDEDRTDGNAPYTFRVVLSPLPNKAIEPAEEIQSLLSLGLTPSATLVLIPAKYASAYAHSNGFLWQTLAYVANIFGSGYGLLTNVLGGITGMLFGRGGDRPPPSENIPLQDLATGRTGMRIRGFQNPDDERRDTQLYNGNSLNFEPRKDDEEDDKSR